MEKRCYPVLFALLSLMVEVRTCNAGVWVRFLQGAPKKTRTCMIRVNGCNYRGATTYKFIILGVA